MEGTDEHCLHPCGAERHLRTCNRSRVEADGLTTTSGSTSVSQVTESEATTGSGSNEVFTIDSLPVSVNLWTADSFHTFLNKRLLRENVSISLIYMFFSV